MALLFEKIEVDLERRLAEGDWTVTREQAADYGREAGRIGGAAACAALGIAPASPLCAEAGGVIGDFVGGVIYDFFSGLGGLFGGGRSDYTERYAEWFAAAEARGLDARRSSLLATIAMLDRLEQAQSSIGFKLSDRELAALLRAKGAGLVACKAAVGPEELGQSEESPLNRALCARAGFMPPREGSFSWFQSAPRALWRVPGEGAQSFWTIDRERFTLPIETAALIGPDGTVPLDSWAIEVQRAYLVSLFEATRKAVVALVAVAAVARAEAKLGVQIEPEPSGDGGGSGAILALGGLGLGVLLLASRR